MAHNHQNVCNFCNNTSDTCCSEADKANKALHIIDARMNTAMTMLIAMYLSCMDYLSQKMS